MVENAAQPKRPTAPKMRTAAAALAAGLIAANVAQPAAAQSIDLASYTCADLLADKSAADSTSRDRNSFEAQLRIGLAVAFLQGYASGWFYRSGGRAWTIPSEQMEARLRGMADTCRANPSVPIASIGKAIADDLASQ